MDCRTLEYKLVPLKLGEAKLAIISTNTTHKLSSGEYNNRVRECAAAVKTLQTVHSGTQLRDFTLEDLEKVKDKLSDTEYRRYLFSPSLFFCLLSLDYFSFSILFISILFIFRALHVITENARTQKAVECLANNDLITLGKLLNESHASLRDNYNVYHFTSFFTFFPFSSFPPFFLFLSFFSFLSFPLCSFSFEHLIIPKYVIICVQPFTQT